MQKVLGNLSRGLLFVLSAPAGTGKTTLIQKLMNEFPCVVQSLSYTTRQPRENEVNGVHYNFVSREEFEKKIEQGEFLEYVDLYGDYYGTSKAWVDEQREKGKHVFLVIDTQGAMKLLGTPDTTFIFVLPPNLEELRTRLLKRRTEPPEVIEKRVEWARKEMVVGQKYDYMIVNDQLEMAYEVLKSITIAVEHNSQYITRRTHGY